MNENLNLVEILKDCPKGTKLYSTVYGDVEFHKIDLASDSTLKIYVKIWAGVIVRFDHSGKLELSYRGECTLFPSSDQRDWSKFTAHLLEKQDKKSSWKPSKEEMDVLYSLSYITNEYDEHKEDVITHLYQDLKQEFFNDSSYENMFSLDNKEDDVRRKSTIQVLEYARSLDAYNQYGKADIDKNIAWLKKQGEPSPILFNSSNIGKNEQKSADKIEPKFKIGDWVVNRFGDSWHIDSLDKKNYQVSDGKGNYNYFPISKQDEMHLWTIQDVRDGDVIFYDEGWICIFKCIHGIWYSSYCFITDDGEFHTGYERHAVDSTIHGNAHPATKEQRDILMKAMNNAGYIWNAKTKTLRRLIKSKFDPKTLEAFDRVICCLEEHSIWQCNLFSHLHPNYKDIDYPVHCMSNTFMYAIPYNEETKHLVGTTEEAPEFYRYWEE